MATGDGLLVRFRPIGNGLDSAALGLLADAADQWGNGLVEITSRGSVQVRGVRAETVEALASAIEAGLPVESSSVPVETPPLARFAPGGRRLLAVADRLRDVIEAQGFASRLGAKVTVLVESDGDLLAIGLGGDVVLRAAGSDWVTERFDGRHIDQSDDAAIAGVIDSLERIAERGTGQRRPACGSLLAVGPVAVGQAVAVVVVPRFGVLDGETLRAIAALMAREDIKDASVAPGRRLVLGPLSEERLEAVRAAMNDLGLIVTTDDPHFALVACSGQGACAAGHIKTRELASIIAEVAPTLLDGSITLHVSGCAKGCAHPAPAQIVVTGAENGVTVALRARAGDMSAVVVAGSALHEGFVRLEGLCRAQRHAQESAAHWLDRLDSDRFRAAFAPDPT
jgi:precorrin-3B synthase